MADRQSSVHGNVARLRAFEQRFFASPLLPMRRLGRVYASASRHGEGWFSANVLDEMDIRYKVEPADLGKIPKKGPVVVVANHPFGMVDGLVLTSLLLTARPDVKLIVNYLLSSVAEMEETCFFVDPFK